MKRELKMLGVLVLAVLAFGLLMNRAEAVKYYRPVPGNQELKKDLKLSGNLEATIQTVDLTSPTKAIDITGKSVITFTTDANQTGATVTGGVAGQIVTLVSGAGSNTLRFDDNGVTLALGSNTTLTEGQGDTLVLLCTEDGKYVKVGGSDN